MNLNKDKYFGFYFIVKILRICYLVILINYEGLIWYGVYIRVKYWRLKKYKLVMVNL